MGFTWSEIDLIKCVESSKREQTVTRTREIEEYAPQHKFSNFPLNYQLAANITAKGYKEPSPIQDQAIPHILAEKDLIGIANTGTGKTAAFLIPLINKVAKDTKQKVLIITPTRELAEQINVEFMAFAKGLGIYSALLIGGKNIRPQIADLSRRHNFVIGTPGRIKDLINRKALSLAGFTNVVLDETDRMVDIGFLSEIKLFISMLPSQRQSLFFSATVSPKVQEIISSFVKDPVTVSVKKRETSENIKQDLVRASGAQKLEELHTLLTKKEFSKVIVFANTKWAIQKLEQELTTRGLKAGAIHGNKSQSQRHSTLQKFKKNEIDVLLATDVAARGLDIQDVSHVINYEMPKSHDDYVHRIGRTGRANKKGIALTFVSY